MFFSAFLEGNNYKIYVMYICIYLESEKEEKKNTGFYDVWENLLASFIKVSKQFLYSVQSFHMLMSCLILNMTLVQSIFLP